MLGQANLAHRSAADWGIRGFLAFACVIGCYASITRSVAYVIRASNPSVAYALVPRDGQVSAQQAGAIASSPNATLTDRRRADTLALLALRKDPTAVLAVNALALNRGIRGDVIGARRLFSYAERLSRRDLQVQLWEIEDAVKRGDIGEALSHYDIALRTSNRAPDLLFPILAAAIADPVVCRELAKTLSASPAWGEQFISFVAAHGTDPHSTAQLFAALHNSSVKLPAEADAVVINALVAKNLTDQAWQYYSLIRRGSDRRRSRDPYFNSVLDTPSVLDWVLVNDESTASSIQRIDGGGIEFALPPSIGASILRQVQLLPPGNYRLVGRSSEIDQPASSLPYWTLTCLHNGREVGRLDMMNSTSAGGMFHGTFQVPVGCSIQALVLTARPSSAVSGSSGTIMQAQLVPVR